MIFEHPKAAGSKEKSQFLTVSLVLLLSESGLLFRLLSQLIDLFKQCWKVALEPYTAWYSV